MKWRNLRPLALAGLAATALATSGLAWADRGGHSPGHRSPRVGVGIGFYVSPDFGYPVYRPAYPYSYYYPGPYSLPPVVAVPAEPPVYIERGNDGPGYSGDASGGAAGPQAPGYWYRCAQPDGYYPYVTHCPGGWQQVPAQPPAQ